MFNMSSGRFGITKLPGETADYWTIGVLLFHHVVDFMLLVLFIEWNRRAQAVHNANSLWTLQNIAINCLGAALNASPASPQIAAILCSDLSSGLCPHLTLTRKWDCSGPVCEMNFLTFDCKIYHNYRFLFKDWHEFFFLYSNCSQSS
jgi:hypothetical protein